MLCARARALYDGRLAPSIDDVHGAGRAGAAAPHGADLRRARRRHDACATSSRALARSGELSAWRASARPSTRSPPRDALARARLRAALVPDLLVEARRIVNTVIAGWHGRRRRGIGENFWQFRPYVEGEAMARIDWRRSARDDHTYVRDREWEAAHTVWLWADPSPSMLYKSDRRAVSKESRALVLVLALAELLSRSGERIAWPGLTDPFTARNGAERLAAQLAHAADLPARPDLSTIRALLRHRHRQRFPRSGRGDRWHGSTCSPATACARHLIEVADPAEESFPYAGRTEFTDPETGEKLTAGRAETLARRLSPRSIARAATNWPAWCRRLGWSFTVNHTDRLASEALVRVHMRHDAPTAATRRRPRMSWLPLSFGFPPMLWGLLALPVIWWLLRLTPPKPQTEVFPPLRILAQRAEARGDAAPEPLVADAAAPAAGRAGHLRAGRARVQPARAAADRRRRRWRWSSTMAGPARADWDRRVATAERLIADAGADRRAGGARLHRREAECRDRPVRCRRRARPAARRRAAAGAGRPRRPSMPASPPRLTALPGATRRRAGRRPRGAGRRGGLRDAARPKQPASVVWAAPERLDAGRPDRRRERGRRLRR